MTYKCEIIMLGTGGGRYVTVTQKRRTAGIRIKSEKVNMHLDPGPGALVNSIDLGLDPRKLNAVFVSHRHTDHFTDAEVLIEAMTHGANQKRGMLVASKSVLGNNQYETSISKYHKQIPNKVIIAVPKLKFQLGDMNITITKAKHSDADTIGFRFETENGDFAYTSDTEYFEDLYQEYEGVRLLILSVLRTTGRSLRGHMNTDDAVKLVKEVSPEQVILTHLGMLMLSKGPEREANLIEKKTSIPTVAAVDGMKVFFGERIKVQTPI